MRRLTVPATVSVMVLGLVLGGGPAQATFPGSNGRIAFVSGWPQRDIYSAAPDGTDVMRLTTFAPKRSAYAPSWSADGTRIVFLKGRNGPSDAHQLWVMDADGSNQHRVLSDPWFYDRAPTFSPDGSKILFARCQYDPGQDRCAVVTVNVDGSRMDRLTTPGPEELVFSEMYSPDGTQIAFSVIFGRGVNFGIFVMDADGSNVELVTPPKIRAFGPDWAPDGSRLVFTRFCCGSKADSIWAVNPDGTGLVRITAPGSRHDFQPVNSPDGTQIVFERDNPDFTRWGLYTMNPDGTGITRIIPHEPYGAAWQPVA